MQTRVRVPCWPGEITDSLITFVDIAMAFSAFACMDECIEALLKLQLWHFSEICHCPS